MMRTVIQSSTARGALVSFAATMDTNDVINGLIRYLALVIMLTFHEFAQSARAY